MHLTDNTELTDAQTRDLVRRGVAKGRRMNANRRPHIGMTLGELDRLSRTPFIRPNANHPYSSRGRALINLFAKIAEELGIMKMAMRVN